MNKHLNNSRVALAKALLGYVSTERLVNYLVQHGWQRQHPSHHRQIVFTAPITAADGSAIYLVLYPTANWAGQVAHAAVALDLVSAIEERSELEVLLDWLPAARAAALRQFVTIWETTASEE